MIQTKSNKKEATNANKYDINDTDLKYQFFPAFVKCYKTPDEGISAFMKRIGMLQRRPDYRQFCEGNKNITEQSFNKIRMTLRWDHVETEKWEELWEKDQKIKSLKIRAEREDGRKMQHYKTTTETNETLKKPDKATTTKKETDPSVRVLQYEQMKQYANLISPVGRFLFFGHIVIDNSLRKFAMSVGLTEEWISKAIFEQSTDSAWIEQFMAELDEKMDMSDSLSQWIMRGVTKKSMDLLVAEYRGAIPDPLSGALALKENGSSSY